MTSRRDNINIRGFGAQTLAPALRLPGDYGPWGRWGTDLHGELAVVEQAQRAEQPTAGRDRFLVASIRKPMCLVTIGPNYHYRLLL